MSSSLLAPTSIYSVRPYCHDKDSASLIDICKDVFDGTDYLPNVASRFASDPTCDFVVLENEETGELLAAGNARKVKEEIVWLESIRTSKKHRGKGIATSLMKEMIRRSKEKGMKRILSCTVEPNHAMKKIFERIGMKMAYKFDWLDMPALRTLPGWSPCSKDGEITPNMLEGFKLGSMVSENAKCQEWTEIESEQELEELLLQTKKQDGIGNLPGVGKLVWNGRDLKESLSKGLVRKIKRKQDEPTAIYALTKDPVIASVMKSPYVCSIIATEENDFNSALWHACSDGIASITNENAFVLAFFSTFDLELHSISAALPVKADSPFVLYEM